MTKRIERSRAPRGSEQEGHELSTKLKRPHRPIVVSALLAVIALGASACGDDDGDDGGQAGSDEPVNVAFFHYGPGNTYAEAALRGAETAAEDGNAELQEFGSSFDAQVQRRQIEDAITTGDYDGLVIQPANGAAIIDVVEEAVDAGIPVASASEPLGPDRLTNEPQVDGMVLSAQEPITLIGKDVGDLIISACEGVNPCEVGYILGLASFPSDPATLDVIKETIAPHENVELVATAEGEYLRDPAYQAAQDMLQANADLDVLAALSDQMALGAEQAVVDAGREGEVKITGGFGSEPGVQAVRDGRWFGNFASLPFDEGRLATEAVIAAARGEEYEFSGGLSPVDDELSPIGRQINQENAEEFDPQWKG